MIHISSEAIVSVVCVKLKTNFGVIKTDHKGWITEFQEKHEIPNVLINSGIYVFNKKIKEYLQGGNIEENAFRKIIKENKLKSFFYDGVWLTVNDKKELKKVEEYLKKFDGLLN